MFYTIKKWLVGEKPTPVGPCATPKPTDKIKPGPLYDYAMCAEPVQSVCNDMWHNPENWRLKAEEEFCHKRRGHRWSGQLKHTKSGKVFNFDYREPTFYSTFSLKVEGVNFNLNHWEQRVLVQAVRDRWENTLKRIERVAERAAEKRRLAREEEERLAREKLKDELGL